jgi:hypothetical protein
MTVSVQQTAHRQHGYGEPGQPGFGCLFYRAASTPARVAFSLHAAVVAAAERPDPAAHRVAFVA